METKLQPCAQVPMHTHENATIVQILSGQYRETFRGACAPLPPLTVITKPPGEKHANDIGTQGACCLVIELPDKKLRELDGVARPCEAPLVHSSGPASHIGLRIVGELRQPDALTPFALEAAALQLLVALSRHRPREYRREPAWMKIVRELLHEGRPDRLRLSDLASVVGVHPVHLAKTFRQIQGCTIGQYARKLQLDRATHMLSSTNIPPSEVAVAAGFYDQSHMSRAIRRETGLTATQIREATTR